MGSLAPEHREDWYKSGLDDATIATCAPESVPPSDFKLEGVESAYQIPYFDLSGKRNCFKRLKLFPPITDSDGHTKKYHQEKDSHPNLYLPPMIDWQSVAGNASQTIVVTEGEKKSASLCQHAMPTIGIPGVWCWRQKLDSGERLVIPTLDQFVWKGRRVELVPDSDVWRKDKFAALCGFFAFAMELVLRGAEVVFIILADERGRKMGVDDFIVSRQGDFLNQWPMLERVKLDDQRLVKVAKWHQDWKAKQANQEALRDQTDHDLTVTESVGLYTVISVAHELTFEFDNLHTHGADVKTELSVTVQGRELRDHVKHNLQSDNAHASLSRNLHALCEVVPWKVLIPKACSMVLKRFREGEPFITIDKHSVAPPLSFVVNPLVMKQHPAVIFAHGGKGKSYFALFVALLVSVGGRSAGLSTLKGRAAYLDWEDTADVYVNRRHALCAGHPELADASVKYKPCYQPLANMEREIARLLHSEGIDFIVIDSLAKAAGGGSDMEATDRLFAALRRLKVSALIIGHSPKPQSDGPSTPSIYGSVFNQNWARSIWEFQSEREPGEPSTLIGLVNHKMSHDGERPPLGLKVTFENGGERVRYESHDVRDSAELGRSQSIPSQIRNLLEDGLYRTAKQIAEALGLPLSKVKGPLSKYAGIKWQVHHRDGQEAQYYVLNPLRERAA